MTRKPIINIGSTVRLKGGSPTMTVERGGKEDKGRIVFQCVWIVDGVACRVVTFSMPIRWSFIDD